MKANAKQKILIGVPTTNKVDIEYVNSILKLLRQTDAHISHSSGSLVYIARNKFVQQAIEGDYTHLLFIDSDMVFNADALNVLLYHNKDIVSGSIFTRVPPYKPCFYEKLKLGEIGETKSIPVKELQDGLQQVEGVSAMSVGSPARKLPKRSRMKPNIAAKRNDIMYPDLDRFVTATRMTSRHIWKIRFQVPNDISSKMRLRTNGSDEMVDIPKSARTIKVTANEMSSIPVARATSPGTLICFPITFLLSMAVGRSFVPVGPGILTRRCFIRINTSSLDGPRTGRPTKA
jgi:hypothetical protein